MQSESTLGPVAGVAGVAAAAGVVAQVLPWA